MASLIKTINQADQILSQYRKGETPFLIACEKLAELGCYNITPHGYAFDGIEWRIK